MRCDDRGQGRERDRETGTSSTSVTGMDVHIAPDVSMPLLGLGTWQARGKAAENAVARALEVGYRHIDTARAYRNEAEIGRALAASDLPREKVFVTTKMWPDRAGHERETIEDSLEALGLDYVDLWLIHWPPSGHARPDVWERFLEVRAEGLARAVGVSNYSVAQLDELEQATGTAPAVNQIEWGLRSTTPRRSRGIADAACSSRATAR
jgi:2,5-diketo-D-gluconate reductase A